MLGHYTQKSSIFFLLQAEKATLCFIRLVVSYNQVTDFAYVCTKSNHNRINGLHSGIPFQL